MDCYLEQEELITGQEQVLDSCLNVLGEVSGLIEPNMAFNPEAFPRLDPLSEEEVGWL